MTARAYIAATMLAIGLLTAACGLAYGLQPVRVTADTKCGNGFGYHQSTDLTDTGSEACAQEQSGRQAVTWGLLAAAIVGLVGAAVSGVLVLEHAVPPSVAEPATDA